MTHHATVRRVRQVYYCHSWRSTVRFHHDRALEQRGQTDVQSDAMSRLRAIGCLGAWFLAGCASSRLREPSQITGDLRFHRLDSRVFGNTRSLRVLVPRGYDAPENRERRYPVLYMNDGQTLFDAASSPVTTLEWHADETV